MKITPSAFRYTTDLPVPSPVEELHRQFNVAIFHEAKKRVAYEERIILTYIRDRAHLLATSPHDMAMEGDLGPCVQGYFPCQITRFNVSEAFLAFPRALPIELKGIAV